MGMFDDSLVPFADHFKENEVFHLEDAKVLDHEIDTKFGKGRPVQLKIGGKWYSVFGQALINQIERMEDGDLPARVAITRVDNKAGDQAYKQIVPAAQVQDQEEIPF